MPLVELERRLPKSNRSTARIQKPTSTSETSVASEPTHCFGSGASQTTSAPAIGSTIRIVVSQLVIASERKTTARTATPARERERVGADEAVLDAARASPAPKRKPRVTSAIEPAISGCSTKRPRPRAIRSAGL